MKDVVDMVANFIACKNAYDQATEVEKKVVDEMVDAMKTTSDPDDIALCVHTIAGALHSYI